MTKKIISESEMIINPDGTIFHLHIHPDQLTDRIILCGDPGRVDMIASFFDTKTFEVSSREFHCIGGSYKGKELMALVEDNGSVDGTHQTDSGFHSMAQAIGKVFEEILSKEK